MFCKCKLVSFFGTHPDDMVERQSDVKYILIDGRVSHKVFFILKGTVFITDRSLKCIYGTLERGSCFGDISALHNKPNEFCYIYNTGIGDDLYMLSIDVEHLIKIVNQDRIAKEILLQRALKKQTMFQCYKKMMLLCLLKTQNLMDVSIDQRKQFLYKTIDNFLDLHEILLEEKGNQCKGYRFERFKKKVSGWLKYEVKLSNFINDG